MAKHPPTADRREWPLIRTELDLLAPITEKWRQQDSRPFSTIYPMLDAAGASTGTFMTLAAEHDIRDGYVALVEVDGRFK